MPGSNDSKKDSLHTVSFRSFALATILLRDVFGYLFIGVGFWAFLFWLGMLSFNSTVAPSDVQSGGLALVLGYPTGRLLFYVGTSLSYIFRRLKWEHLMPTVFEEFSDTPQIANAAFRPFGIPFNAENSSLLCDSLLTRKIFAENPPLYFLYLARPNTLRLMNETTLGFLFVGSILYLAQPGNALVWWNWPLSASVVAASALMVARSRKEQARTKVLTAWLYLCENPDVANPKGAEP